MNSSQAVSQEFSMDQVEAAFIGQLVRYIEWPDDAMKDGPLIITVVRTVVGTTVGKSPLFEQLKALADSKKNLKRPLVIQTIQGPSRLAKTHILVFTEDPSDQLKDYLKAVQGTNTLTISRSPGLAQRGVMINFYEDSGKLRFEVNLDAVRLAKISISSQLLKLARISSP